MQLDISQVAPRLFQGGRVDPARSYRPFAMVVLCAVEHQPELPRFAGTLLQPAFDDTLTPQPLDLQRAHAAAQQVVLTYRHNPTSNILITCWMGWNRSGLVTGLALNQLTTWSTAQIIHTIRQARGNQALSNLAFQQIIARHNRHDRR